MESLEIHIDHNIASVLLFLLFPSLFFSFFLCPERKRTLLFRQLAYNARRQHFWEQYEERAWPRASTRTKGAKGRDFAARTIINGFDLNFLFVCPPLMFVDRSRASCNLFFFSLFIYFPPLFFSPFQTFRLLLIYRPKEVSTCEDSRLIVKRIFPSGLNSNGKRRYIYHLVLKKFLIKVLKLILFPIRKEWTLKFKILFFFTMKKKKDSTK